MTLNTESRQTGTPRQARIWVIIGVDVRSGQTGFKQNWFHFLTTVSLAPPEPGLPGWLGGLKRHMATASQLSLHQSAETFPNPQSLSDSKALPVSPEGAAGGQGQYEFSESASGRTHQGVAQGWRVWGHVGVTVRCGWRQGRRLGHRPRSEVRIHVRVTLTNAHHERRSGCIWNVCVCARARDLKN